MPLEDHLVEIAGLLAVEAAQAEIVDDQDVGSQQSAQDFVGGVVGARLVEALQEVIGAQEADLMTGAAGRVAEGTGQKSLPDADGAEEDDVLVAFDEAEREEVADAVAIEGDRRVPVEALDGVLLVEARLGEPDAEIGVIASVDLVLEHEFEQIELGDLLCAGVGDAIRERRDDPGQFQTLEDGLQGLADFHHCGSPFLRRGGG